MKLKVPYYKQKEEWTCGPASLQMAMSFLGEFRTQEELAKLLKLEENGWTGNDDMVRAAQKAGFYCYVAKETTVEEIKYFISLGYPVIVNYIEPKGQEGHFSVVHGYGWFTKKIIMHDPYHGKNIKWSEKKFLNWWRSGFESHTRWMMVLSKTPFTLGKQVEPIKEEVLPEEEDLPHSSLVTELA